MLQRRVLDKKPKHAYKYAYAIYYTYAYACTTYVWCVFTRTWFPQVNSFEGALGPFFGGALGHSGGSRLTRPRQQKKQRGLGGLLV